VKLPGSHFGNPHRSSVEVKYELNHGFPTHTCLKGIDGDDLLYIIIIIIIIIIISQVFLNKIGFSCYTCNSIFLDVLSVKIFNQQRDLTKH